MNWDLAFFLTSAFLGIGLAMDAFSVSVVNGLNSPNMPRSGRHAVAGTFAFFQALMPMLGWFLVHSLLLFFESLQRWIPWIALLLLGYLGIRMILEGLNPDVEKEESDKIRASSLFLQGIATSIDALSAGLTFSEYGFLHALVASGIIAAVTYVICLLGVHFGRYAGMKLTRWAPIVGGIILIVIGIRIAAVSIFG